MTKRRQINTNLLLWLFVNPLYFRRLADKAGAYMTIIPALSGDLMNKFKLLTDILAGYGLYYLFLNICKNFDNQSPAQ